MFKKLCFLFILTILFSGCSEEVVPLAGDAGRGYFPIAIGNYWIYDVTETKYIRRLKTQPGDSVTYQLRERVDTLYRDQAGSLTYKLIRSRRAHAGMPWSADSIVLVNKSLSNVQVTRNNWRTINLVFPVTDAKKWNGNAYNLNSDGEEEYFYQQVGNPFTLQDTTFSNTITVVQFQNENLIDLNDRQEVYAEGVGLIYKRQIDYEYCNGASSQNCEIGKGFIVNGFKRIQRIRSFDISQ